MSLKVKKLTETATLPTFGDSEAAGCDIYVDTKSMGLNVVTVEPNESVVLNTGIACEFPDGYFGLIFPRSSVGVTRHLSLANTAGVIDNSYRGEIKLVFRNNGNDIEQIFHGERLAQMILLPYLKYEIEQVDELSETERGEGGFGSTGR